MEFFNQWREILLPLLIFLALLIFRHISQMVKARHLKDVAALLNGEVVIRPFSPPKIKGTYMGMQFQIVFTPEGRGSPGMLVVTFEYPCPFAMEIHQKGQMPHLGELLSRGRVVQSGEEDFDEQFLLRVEKDIEKAEHYLNNKSNREMVKEAFKRGYVSVKYSERGITLSKPGRFLQAAGVTSEELSSHLAFAARLGERF
jgi:hypothetical protein